MAPEHHNEPRSEASKTVVVHRMLRQHESACEARVFPLCDWNAGIQNRRVPSDGLSFATHVFWLYEWRESASRIAKS